MRDLAARRVRLVEVETPTAVAVRPVAAVPLRRRVHVRGRRAAGRAARAGAGAGLGAAGRPARPGRHARAARPAGGRGDRAGAAAAGAGPGLPGRRGRGRPAARARAADRPPRSRERAADPAAAPDWLAGLAAQRRVLELRIGGQARWAAVEDAGRLRDALGVALPPGVPGAFTEPVADPLRDLVLRYARTHGPFTALEAAQRYGLGVAVVSGTLHRLAAAGSVVGGRVPGRRAGHGMVRVGRAAAAAPPLPGQAAQGGRAGAAAGVRRLPAGLAARRAAGPDRGRAARAGRGAAGWMRCTRRWSSWPGWRCRPRRWRRWCCRAGCRATPPRCWTS